MALITTNYDLSCPLTTMQKSLFVLYTYMQYKDYASRQPSISFTQAM